MTRRCSVLALAFVLAVATVGCGSSSDGASDRPVTDPTDDPTDAQAPNESDQQFPDILDATASENDGTWTFDVTVSSPYDTPERYADGWRVLDPDGEVLGEHELGHDHADEQPFTRTQQGVDIPESVDEVTIEGRDQANGYGGDTVTVDIEAARAD